jgi:hypothetical protein
MIILDFFGFIKPVINLLNLYISVILIFSRLFNIKSFYHVDILNNSTTNFSDFKIIFSLLLTSIGFLFFSFQCKLLSMLMGLKIQFSTLSLFNSITNVVEFISIFFSGISISVAPLIYFFDLVNLNYECVFNLFLPNFFTVFYIIGILGLFTLLNKPVLIFMNNDYLFDFKNINK